MAVGVGRVHHYTLLMTQISGPLSAPCKGKGDVEVQRAPACKLWTELSKEALGSRVVLVRHSGH